LSNLLLRRQIFNRRLNWVLMILGDIAGSDPEFEIIG
jgi:hypothetical protein